MFQPNVKSVIKDSENNVTYNIIAYLNHIYILKILF